MKLYLTRLVPQEWTSQEERQEREREAGKSDVKRSEVVTQRRAFPLETHVSRRKLQRIQERFISVSVDLHAVVYLTSLCFFVAVEG